MESGILYHNLDFMDGEDITFSYDFHHEEYPQLLELYGIDKIAGKGTEFQKALALMDEFSPRLRHKSDFNNALDLNALTILEYCLDNKKQGINCRYKAQVFNEMCLALGIYARKFWLMPCSIYDHERHAVNEIWDTTRNKWIMMDITNNRYWVDEYGTPLSALEIRQKGALNEFCTPVAPGDDLSNLEKTKQQSTANIIYIMKNMFFFVYLDTYSVGESGQQYCLYPKNTPIDYEYIISIQSCLVSPIQ